MELNGVDVPAVEVDESEEDAAFEHGFNGTDLEPVTPEPVTSEPVGQQEPEPAPDTISIEALRDMVEDQKRIAQQAHAKLSGKVGELQQKIEAARGSVSGISPKARERLQNEFPELADMLFEGAEEPPQQTYTPSPSPSIDVEAVKDELSKNFERKLLTRDHKDWETVVASNEFDSWKNTQLKPEDAAELDASWDSDFISDKLTEFKKWRQDQTDAATKRTEVAKQKQNRLEAAITPQGRQVRQASYSDDDEESAMEAAFKSR